MVVNTTDTETHKPAFRRPYRATKKSTNIWPGKSSKCWEAMTTKVILMGLLLMPPLAVQSQNTTERLSSRDSVYTLVDQQPEYPGGHSAMSFYLSRNIRYPANLERESLPTGRLFISFVVNKTGYVSDIRLTNGAKGVRRMANSSLEKTIVQAVQKMPRWKPGRVRGKAVAVRYLVPFNIEPE